MGLGLISREEDNKAMMKTLKIVTVAAMLAAFFVAMVMVSAASGTPVQDQFDAAGTYKAKCVACHGPKAEKKFDKTKADADLVQIVLKGMKAEKPPNMPGYEEKGITEDQSKALVTLMKSFE
jgi:mono/diheme cytochrome c family protein